MTWVNHNSKVVVVLKTAGMVNVETEIKLRSEENSSKEYSWFL